MYGLEFHKADNALICGSAEFEVRRRNDAPHYYKIISGPHGMRLGFSPFWPSPDDPDAWVVVNGNATDADIEAVLPKGFGLDWTFQQFMLALIFYAEGHRRGYAQGSWDRQKAERRKRTSDGN